MKPRKIVLPSIHKATEDPNSLRIIVNGEDTGGKMSILEQTYFHGETVLPHNHTRESHLVEVLHGSFRFDFPDSSIEMSARELVNIPDGLWHGFTALQKVNILRVYIYPAGLEELFLKLQNDSGKSKLRVDELISQYGTERDPNVRLGKRKY